MFVFEPVGVAFVGEDVRVVDEAVDHGFDRNGVAEVPQLLFHGNAGVAIKEAEGAWCRENLSNLDVIDLGDAIHFVQETHPETIGAELSTWFGGL